MLALQQLAGLRLQIAKTVLLITVASCTGLQAAAQSTSRATSSAGPNLVFQFSTVGDSRQDPQNPDPTTLPLSRRTKYGFRTPKPGLASCRPCVSRDRTCSSSTAT
jgi:hypothetical protein